MTHLSPYSYLDRLEPNLIVFAFLCYYCFVLKHASADVDAVLVGE